MTTNVITAPYNDAFSVSFTSEAWLNATAVAKHYGKLPGEWLRLDSTIEYIDCLCEFQLRDNPSFDKNQLTMIKKGSSVNGGGTWFHPKLIVPFARWLEARFAVWCDMQIEKILRPVLPLIATPSLPLKKTQKAVPGGLSLETQDELKALVIQRAEHLPKDKQGGAITGMWSSLNTHFGTNVKNEKGKALGYKHIPEGARLECISLIGRYALDDGFVTLPRADYEKLKALPSPAKEGEFLPNPTKDELIGILTRQVTAVEAQLKAAEGDYAGMTKEQVIQSLKPEYNVIPRKEFSATLFVLEFIPANHLLAVARTAIERSERIELGKKLANG